MPELPEVETVVRNLRPGLVGETIRAFEAAWPKVTAPAKPEAFARQVVGRTIQGVNRRGKYIILQLDRGYVHVHLRMTGQLFIIPAGEDASNTQIRAQFLLSNGTSLLFRDQRKFGRIGYLDDLAPLEARLGPEPLAANFTGALLADMLAGRRRQIKPLLLDQSFIAGLGNIYVDEALFAARIHPQTVADRIPADKVSTLHRAIRWLLRRSIERQGTTFSSFRFGRGETGGYRDRLKVFGRGGRP
ncbi:MAG: DNA-formamidopyrimidine glycosylase, partial [Candidatus Neomarinimicrobiota bacterium]